MVWFGLEWYDQILRGGYRYVRDVATIRQFLVLAKLKRLTYHGFLVHYLSPLREIMVIRNSIDSSNFYCDYYLFSNKIRKYFLCRRSNPKDLPHSVSAPNSQTHVRKFCPFCESVLMSYLSAVRRSNQRAS